MRSALGRRRTFPGNVFFFQNLATIILTQDVYSKSNSIRQVIFVVGFQKICIRIRSLRRTHRPRCHFIANALVLRQKIFLIQVDGNRWCSRYLIPPPLPCLEAPSSKKFAHLEWPGGGGGYVYIYNIYMYIYVYMYMYMYLYIHIYRYMLTPGATRDAGPLHMGS